MSAAETILTMIPGDTGRVPCHWLMDPWGPEKRAFCACVGHVAVWMPTETSRIVSLTVDGGGTPKILLGRRALELEDFQRYVMAIDAGVRLVVQAIGASHIEVVYREATEHGPGRLPLEPYFDRR